MSDESSTKRATRRSKCLYFRSLVLHIGLPQNGHAPSIRILLAWQKIWVITKLGKFRTFLGQIPSTQHIALRKPFPQFEVSKSSCFLKVGTLHVPMVASEDRCL